MLLIHRPGGTPTLVFTYFYFLVIVVLISDQFGKLEVDRYSIIYALMLAYSILCFWTAVSLAVLGI